ncbi:hypothetical protein BD413DRAFT_150956 [Trametes elegans]|nr:hypothetical protein BD413DRAFT_150956 [Trametes elegans]
MLRGSTRVITAFFCKRHAQRTPYATGREFQHVSRTTRFCVQMSLDETRMGCTPSPSPSPTPGLSSHSSRTCEEGQSVPAPGRTHRRRKAQWTPEQMMIVSILIKEKKQLREAVRRCEAAEDRVERLRHEPLARQRLDKLLREIERKGMRPNHARELREILEDFPEHEAAPLKRKLQDYETRRLLFLTRAPAVPS